MSPRRATTLAWGSLVLTVTLCLAAVTFLVLAWDVPTLPNEFGPKGFAIAFALSLGGVGAIVAARRPENPIGWLFCAMGVLSGVMAIGAEYARWALIARDGEVAGGLYAAWLEEWLWIPLVAGLPLVASLFPDGHFLSRGWGRATLISFALVIVPTVLTALVPALTVYRGYPNPVGVGGPSMTDIAEGSISLLLPLMFLGTASAIVRFRRARGDERQQLKWLVLSISAVVAMTTLYAIIAFSLSEGSNPQGLEWAEWGMILGFVAVPFSIAFGVLKYRLYDIDVVINKAVVYGAIAVFITVVYVGVVVGVGAAVGSQGDVVLSALAAAIVALAFQPARRWAQRLANRVVYGERATPYEVLAELGVRLAGEYAADDVLHRVAAALGGGLGAERVAVWLEVGDELRPAAGWPDGATTTAIAHPEAEIPDELDGMRAFVVRHQGEVLGAIGVRKPVSEPITTADERLVADLAGQAGLVLRNVRLIQDLRASRQRLVAAQDGERRRIERNIHDGAQQQLVALAVKLRLADAMVGRDEAKAHALLAELQTETADALENLRDLARGIYPPLLADQGLAAALEAQARKATIPVEVSRDGVGRYPQDVEAAVYFCVLEALQNVAKYAGATRAIVRLEAADGTVVFSVDDDGAGFDPSRARGSGLTNMRDRLDALGGELRIVSAPGEGSSIRGWVPAAPVG